MSAITSHKDLVVWQKSIVLAGKVYAATGQVPSQERFGLSRQLRRAAVSIPSNIAEGSARRSRSEFLQFLHIARGSLAELETQLTIAEDQRFIVDAGSLLIDVAEIGRLLNGLISKLADAARTAHAKSCSPTNR